MAESVLCKEVIQIVEDKARGKDIIFWIFYYIRYQINNSKRIKQHFNKSIDNIKDIRMGIILLKFSSLYIQDLYCVLFIALLP